MSAGLYIRALFGIKALDSYIGTFRPNWRKSRLFKGASNGRRNNSAIVPATEFLPTVTLGLSSDDWEFFFCWQGRDGRCCFDIYWVFFYWFLDRYDSGRQIGQRSWRSLYWVLLVRCKESNYKQPWQWNCVLRISIKK